MKRLIFILALLAFGVCLQAQNAHAELARQYIREKLVFYYIDDPTEAAPRKMRTINVNKNAIAEGRDINSPLWTNAANLGLRQLLVDLLCKPEDGGNLKLQRIASEALLITDKKIVVYLYNDSENKEPNSDWTGKIYCDSPGATNFKCWPCANYNLNRSQTTGGEMALGAGYFNPATSRTADRAKSKTSTFLHELVHTQIRVMTEASVPNANVYGVAGRGHFFSEILPSKNWAFNEGVASSFAYQYHLPMGQNAISWFNNNINLWVDNISSCGGGGSPSYHCMNDRLLVAGQSGTAGTLSGIAGNLYRIRNIPPEFLVHNETILANLIYEYTRQFNDPFKLVENIRAAHPSIVANTGDGFTFLPLYKEILKTAKDWRTAGSVGVDSTRGEILVAGITDFYLGYGVSSKPILENALGATFNNTYPAIEDYFSTHRTELHGLRHDTTTWAQVQLRLFGERMNVVPAGSPAAGGVSDGN